MTVGGDILLGTHANAFDGALSLVTSGGSSATIRNTSATATVDSVTALSDLSITHTTTGVSLDTIAVNNGLTINAAGGVQQTGSWDVDGDTSITATGNIQLESTSFNNSLDGTVTIAAQPGSTVGIRNTSSSASLDSVSSISDLTVIHTATGVTLAAIDISSDLLVEAAGDIQQTAAWDVDGNTTLTATGHILLGNAGFDNLFDGSLFLTGATNSTVEIRNTSGTATVDSVSTVNNLAVTHTAAGVSLGLVDLNNNLSIDANGDIQQTGSWTVDGNTSLTATGNIALGSNVFVNRLDGTVALLSANDIAIRNTSNTATIDTLSAIVSSLSVEHTQAGVSMGTLNVSGDLTIASFADISQSGIWDVDGNTNLHISATGSVSLATAANDFAMPVSITTSGTIQDVRLRNENSSASLPTLPAALDNLEIIFGAASVALPGVVVNGDLDVTSHGAITQLAGLTVTGSTTLVVSDVSSDISLHGQPNLLSGPISVSTTGTGTLGDVRIRSDAAVARGDHDHRVHE